MLRFEKESKEICQALSLRWGAVAGKFSENPQEGSNSRRRLKVCDAFDVVRREKALISLSKENCVCSGGRHFVGLEPLSLESVAAILCSERHRVYGSAAAALASVGRQPQPLFRGASSLWVLWRGLRRIRTWFFSS